jgi:hypothetical protein
MSRHAENAPKVGGIKGTPLRRQKSAYIRWADEGKDRRFCRGWLLWQ